VEDIAELPKNKVTFVKGDFEDVANIEMQKKHKKQGNTTSRSQTEENHNSNAQSTLAKSDNPKIIAAKSDQKINIDKLLDNFSKFAKEPISKDKVQRQNQAKKQNQVIDKILSKSREFILKSQKEDVKNNQTIFIYADPIYSDLETKEGRERQVIYIRNNDSGKIDVLYGKKAQAIIIERPNEEKNGLITKVSSNNIEKYGESQNSIFQSFNISPTDLPNSSPSNPKVEKEKSEISKGK
jgi:hypothetical protein